MQAVLSLKNIAMYYHSGTSVVPGITGVNLDFFKGEFVVITGESGSGKTSLLNVISAMLPYHDGELYINGEPTSAYGEEDWEIYRREHIGFVFQDYNLISSYSVLENVVSAVLLRGVSKKEAEKQAIEYIMKVGLGDLLRRKASKLSSGQKQRLAIARALAKDTEIIVADEPTGNLDSENGRQIVELLQELSREKLVIMVSHNIEEALPYADRRIRIHSSRVVADERLHRTETKNVQTTAIAETEKAEKTVGEEAEKTVDDKTAKKERAGKHGKTAGSEKNVPVRLALFNLKAQPIGACIVALFMIFCTLAGTVFGTGFLASADDTATKIYDNEAFLNGDTRRIVVKREDGQTISKEDVERLRKVSYVEEVERFDKVADINFYSVEGKDFYFEYDYKYLHSGPDVYQMELRTVMLKSNDKFIRSASCITEDDLLAGRLPETTGEIVCYGDESLVGTEKELVVSDQRYWGEPEYAIMTYEIVGVLKEETEQIYFSEAFCETFYQNDGTPFIVIDVFSEMYTAILLPDEHLSGDVVKLAKSLVPVRESAGEGYGAWAKFCVAEQSWMINGWGGSYYYTNNPWFVVNEVYVDVLTETQDSSRRIQLVSPEVYAQLFPESPEVYQATLYIKDYAYTDDVLKEIKTLGYRGMSPFRAGSLEYDSEKVNEHLITLIICMVAFIGVYFVEVLVLKAFLKFKKKDYQVLHSMGMTRGQLKNMVLAEYMLSGLAAILVSAVAVIFACRFGGELVYNLVKYLRWYHYIVFVMCEVLAVFVLALSYGAYLGKQFTAQKNKEKRGSDE